MSKSQTQVENHWFMTYRELLCSKTSNYPQVKNLCSRVTMRRLKILQGGFDPCLEPIVFTHILPVCFLSVYSKSATHFAVSFPAMINVFLVFNYLKFFSGV